MFRLIRGDCTANKTDIVISFKDMWGRLKALNKEDGAVVLFGNEPFSSLLRISNLKNYKYDWYWDKINRLSNHLNVKKQSLRQIENVMVFYKRQSVYNPIKFKGELYEAVSRGRKSDNYGFQVDGVKTICTGERWPRNIISIKGDERGTVGRIHLNQKPIKLLEYLVYSYQ